MGHIRVLPDNLIDRIAAGEVVERPASVVKELVENSLDAGSRSIRIELRSGGKQRVRVSDDGRGMDRDDALLALERHATSKLSAAADLDAITTLGFRGEALSSIAAVSQFVLSTSVADGQGTEIHVRGGRIQSVEQAGLPRGTSVQVDRLFFNVPARRKFLRSDATELSHIVRLATRYALANPEVRVVLQQDDRRILHADPAAGLRERIAQIYGRELSDKLLPFEGDSGEARVFGFAGRPAEAVPRRDSQHHFVNGRSVQDRVLAHAVAQAYGNTVPRGCHATMFLFVVVDPARVDVNVHPQKTEVRFPDAAAIHDLVREAISACLSHESVVPGFADLRPAAAATGLDGTSRTALGFGEAARRPPVETTAGQAGLDLGEPRPRKPDFPALSGDLVEAIHDADTSGARRRAMPLAQYLDSYIVAQDEQGLVLVDQHAAHERVLFERYLRDAESDEVEVQKLLFPLTIELAPHERIVIEEELDEFRRLGFLVEPFGGNTVRLQGVPAVAADLDAQTLLRELVGEARAARSASADLPQLRRRVVTSASCQAAIKVHYPLTRETMQQLLDDLFVTVNPSTCPHGRPVLFRLSRDDIERAFRRR